MTFRIEDEWEGFTNHGPRVYETTGYNSRMPGFMDSEPGFYNVYDVVVSY